MNGTAESEASSLLMSVIRSLSATGDNEQREREKNKLERDYRASDSKLDKLVTANRAELAEAIQTYRDVTGRVGSTLDKIRDVKSQLASCRLKLRYKQDELKRLWEESEEHQTIVKILNDIQEVKEVSDDISECLAKNQYSKAGSLLTSALKTVQVLEDVEGLRDLRTDVEGKREAIYETVISQVESFIFENSCKSVLTSGTFQRVKSGGSGRENELKRLQQLLNPEVKEAILSKVEVGKITEMEMVKLTSYCHCLIDVGKLQVAVDKIKIGLCPQFRKIIDRTIEHAQKENSKSLTRFLKLVVDQVRLVVNALNQARTAFATVANERKLSIQLFSVKQVWTAVQVEIQDVLQRHIISKNKDRDNSAAKRQVTSVDVRDQFSKKKVTKPKTALFSFESSAHGLAMEVKGKVEQNLPLICEAKPENLADASVALQGLIREIETDLGYTSSNHCELFSYLTQTAAKSVLNVLEDELESSLSEMSKMADSSYALITDQATLTRLDAKKPIYQWCISAEKLVRILCHLAASIPTMKDTVAQFLSDGLGSFLERAQTAYSAIIDERSEDRRIFSSAWVKDDDIARLLKSLPSWHALQNVGSKSPEHETPEEALDKFFKESKMLTGNLSEAALSSREMINDISELKALATLHESLEWLTLKIVSYLRSVFKNSAELSTGAKIFTIPRGFLELSETCLLVLHLEVRVHCFYHLVSQTRTVNYWLASESQEPDVEVSKLCQYINNVDLVLGPVLQPAKQKYIIEGVGHLCGSILINNASTVKRINAAGARKMVRNVTTLHQTIGALSSRREPGLEKARQYYEMMLLTPDELLNSILEKGKLFKEFEYIDALRLLHRSKGGPVEVLNQHLDRLSDLLGEVGVTV